MPDRCITIDNRGGDLRRAVRESEEYLVGFSCIGALEQDVALELAAAGSNAWNCTGEVRPFPGA